MNISDFIAAEAAQPFAWGVNDCASTADRWVQLVHGFSPMARYGRHHQSRDEAHIWLSEPGSIAVAFNRVMRKSGFKRTVEPKPGDLGLVIYAQRMCIAIHTGSAWFSRHEDGLIAAPLETVWKAWSI